ncbi:MAG TPA: hypothetical protein VN419_04255 [Humidesulfovibrio sp.]|uniref:hypothetical protein n=1 Tax=Humidesulfovibrio sp. TaxID=2910988 RepID=UPI002CB75DE0|nr:hypothetical protein [Humidesulfovibrio sp.]HWR03213.1 hypothetical protein [Humidesulfovibrio sp.]
MTRATWEKVFEYASMPVHGTLSRKLRKGIKIQVNEGRIYEMATVFLGEDFLRVTEKSGKEMVNTYYSWEKLVCVRTLGEVDE